MTYDIKDFETSSSSFTSSGKQENDRWCLKMVQIAIYLLQADSRLGSGRKRPPIGLRWASGPQKAFRVLRHPQEVPVLFRQDVTLKNPRT